MKKKTQGQSTIEFTFAIIVLLLIIYGLIMVFRWVGLSFAEQRIKHEQQLKQDTTIERQLLNDADYQPRRLQAVYTNVYK